MSEFYLVSFNELDVNQKLSLQTGNNIPFWSIKDFYSESEVKETLKNLFPKGISMHGIQYFSTKIDFNNKNNLNVLMIELIFELVRKAKFSDKPSRFLSVFGCKSYEMAKKFRKDYRNNKGGIYKVLAENWSKFDMNFLKLGTSILGSQILAEKYWGGTASNNPFWEILMTGEIKVVEKVKENMNANRKQTR